jgi:hypothetical protein
MDALVRKAATEAKQLQYGSGVTFAAPVAGTTSYAANSLVIR